MSTDGGQEATRSDRAPEVPDGKQPVIKQHELEQITPKKVAIPDSEIPESTLPNWKKAQIKIDKKTGLKFKRIRGKIVFIEK